MSKEFKDVIKFNQEVVKLKPTAYLSEKQLKWFKGVINEELEEFEVANNNFAETFKAGKKLTEDQIYEMQAAMVDALIDLIYFAYGRLYEINTTPEEFECMWDAVQEANMSKKRGDKGRGSDNDAIKPEGWKGPEEKLIEFKKNASQKQLDRPIQTTCDKNIQISLFDDLFSKDTNTKETIQIALSGEAKCALNSLETAPYKNYVADFKSENTLKSLEHDLYDGATIRQRIELLKQTSGAETGRITTSTGVKYDQEKPNLALVFGGFSRALLDVGYVGTFGAKKYSPNGWKLVPDLQDRYSSALLRHMFAVLSNEEFDSETGRHHLAHVAWNALALLEDKFTTRHLPYIKYNEEAIKKSNLTLENYKKEQNNG